MSSTEGGVAGDRSRQGVVALAVLVGILLFACGVSLVSGPTGVGISELIAYLTGGADQLDARDRIILEAVRLPRTALGMLIGAGLAVSGAMMQGLFRNPLADPGIVGVTSGAALFAVAAISLGEGALATVAVFFGPHFLPIMAFFGGLLNTWVLYLIATKDGATSTTTLILAGIAVAAISGALTGLMIFVADDRALRDITFWSLGSLGGATPAKVLATLPFIIVVLAIILDRVCRVGERKAS